MLRKKGQLVYVLSDLEKMENAKNWGPNLVHQIGQKLLWKILKILLYMKFTKILAMIFHMKNLQKSWQWYSVWKIYKNPGNGLQYKNLRKSWQ